MADSISLAGRLLKYWRTKLEMTQDEIAEGCDVTRMAVSQWECGGSRPSEERLEWIAEVLGISLAKFYSAENKV